MPADELITCNDLKASVCACVCVRVCVCQCAGLQAQPVSYVSARCCVFMNLSVLHGWLQECTYKVYRHRNDSKSPLAPYLAMLPAPGNVLCRCNMPAAALPLLQSDWRE